MFKRSIEFEMGLNGGCPIRGAEAVREQMGDRVDFFAESSLSKATKELQQK